MSNFERNDEPLVIHPVHNPERTWDEVMNEQRQVETPEATLGYGDDVMFPQWGPMRRIPGTLHKNLFVVHSYNSDTNNLRPWITRVGDSCSLPRVMPEFQPLMDDANYEDWSKIMDIYAKGISFKEINQDSMCVAHSIGCIFLIKYIAQNDIKLDTCAFLAGFLGKIEDRDDINKVAKGFMPTEEEIDKFKANVKNIYSIYDPNDKLLNRPYHSSLLTEDFADRLGATKIVVSKGGHFGGGTGTTEIPELEEIIRAYSARKDLEHEQFKKDCLDFARFISPDNSNPIPVNGFDLFLLDRNKLTEEGKAKYPEDGPTYCLVSAHFGHNCVGSDDGCTHKYYVLRGQGEFIVNGRSILVASGSSITIYPGDKFYYRNVSEADVPLTLIERIEPKFNEKTFHNLQDIDYQEEYAPRRA